VTPKRQKFFFEKKIQKTFALAAQPLAAPYLAMSGRISSGRESEMAEAASSPGHVTPINPG
jgi:hypothetical protein